MSSHFMNTARWFSGALCCRYLVVRFDRLSVPRAEGGGAAEWHWALGLFRDGEFEVLGAWREEGVLTPQRVAADLYERGLERVAAVVGCSSVVGGMARFCPKACGPADELAGSAALGARMRRCVRWSESAGARLQARMQRAVRTRRPIGDEAAGEFMALAFQRADRDLLRDRWDRRCPAPYGRDAFVASLARAA